MKKLILAQCICIGLAIQTSAQSAFIKRSLDDSYLLDKYEILHGKYTDSLHTTAQPFSQKDAVRFLEFYLKQHADNISLRQATEIKHFIAKNGEWATGEDATATSDYPLLRTFYKKKNHLVYVNKSNYTLMIDPVIAYQQMTEQGNSKQNLFINTRGVEIKGNIAKKIGVYTMFSDNQERGPQHHQNFVLQNNAVPGMGYYKDFKTNKPGAAQDYINAVGYVDVEAIKNTVNVTFGYDRLFIGNGYRSLFLSDFSAPATFLKINTRLWKFNYQNLYMELIPQYARGGDKLLEKKYLSTHHLSINPTKWLNIGLFESVVYGRDHHLDFGYLNPVVLYRSIEQNNGSPDNALMGIDAKINTGLKTILYGQVLFDEFKFSELKANDGWWANKWGLQMGIKTADIFGIKNLIAQAEINIVRPFTYSFRDSVADYTHYNQPLAHPYGANFAEMNVVLRYKPTEKMYVTLQGFYNKQGRDTLGSSVSFGGNPIKDYGFKNANRGISLFNGYASTVKFVNANLSYEVRDNLYIDLGLTYRDEQASHVSNPTFHSVQAYGGFRLNASRRMYNY